MVFMEKPGIEPATPGLQGIALIHYTTGALRGMGDSLLSISPAYCGQLVKIFITLNLIGHLNQIGILIYF